MILLYLFVIFLWLSCSLSVGSLFIACVFPDIILTAITPHTSEAKCKLVTQANELKDLTGNGY